MTTPQLTVWPADDSTRLRRSEITAVVGRGDETWRRAAADLLRWKVKTRSGFRVEDDRAVAPGAELIVTARVLGITVNEPIRVEHVVESADRVGFSYRTLPSHPVSGEEAFIVHRDGDDVVLTIRSLTGPSLRLPWRPLFPVLQLAQRIVKRRYLRALITS